MHAKLVLDRRLPAGPTSARLKILFLITASLVLISLLFSGIAVAQVRYVTDEFEVMLRTGPSVKNKIVRVLTSGDRVDVVTLDAENDYSEVTTARGDTGYILKRYLVNNKSARDQVKSLQAQINTLRSKPGELQTMLADSQEENKQLIAQNVALTEQLKTTSNELAQIKKISQEAMSLAQRNVKLEGEAQDMLLQLDKVRMDNKVLKDQDEKRWFILGSGAILVGLVLGWVLSISKRPRRQSSWGA